MEDAHSAERIRRTYQALRPEMDERMRRQWAAAEARGLGYGGIASVSRTTGLSRTTIAAGLAELDLPAWQRAGEATRIRRPGGGRRPLTRHDPGLLPALESLIEPTTRGDPESTLRWTCKSTRRLADELTRMGHPVGRMTVAGLLHEAGYSLQADRKTREGSSHPDRDAQFRYIDRMVRGRLRTEQPAVSVDTKKKELVGDFKNNGREWHPAGQPPEVRVHDFADQDLGKVIPYGVYDILNDQGWVSVGIDHDTAQFATHSIRSWWARMGCRHFRRAEELLITADGGGSNGSRCRFWKVCLQELADELGLGLVVCHFPPGTSKWNKVEHRLFSFITQNWRGRPLDSRETVVNLIASTRTRTGLVVKAALDTNHYETAIKVSDAEYATLRMTRHRFHGDWNYTIRPRS
jgi:Rhodopirellula transposase DDE domain